MLLPANFRTKDISMPHRQMNRDFFVDARCSIRNGLSLLPTVPNLCKYEGYHCCPLYQTCVILAGWMLYSSLRNQSKINQQNIS